uniref:Transmembrane proteins 14C n=1 Tax=Mesocestoides corti TaxID=53468 RepID=A0A5K3EY08_MESCO
MQDFLAIVPLSSCVRLLNCLSASYTAFFEFDQCNELKKLIQQLLKLQSPANLYQHSHLAATLLQMILLQTIQNGLAANYCAQLCESVKATFSDFDANLSKLKVANFRRFPLQIQASNTEGEFVSPLPWLKSFVPDASSNHKEEQFALLLAGLSTHLTQLYLYLLHIEKNELATAVGSPVKRCKSLPLNRLPSDVILMEPDVEKRKSSELNPTRKSRIHQLLSGPQRLTIDASTTTVFCETKPTEGDEGLAKDRAVRIASLADTLATLPDGFFALSSAPNSPSSSFSALESVFTCTAARLIAVAEHAPLRKALATWFLRLVQSRTSSVEL